MAPTSDEYTCAHCGNPAQGYAKAGQDRLCHPDTGMDCYHLVTVYGHDACGSLSACGKCAPQLEVVGP